MVVPAKLKNSHFIQKIKPLKRTMFFAIYPKHCPFCLKLLPSSEYLCSDCARKVPYITEPTCYRCGKQISSACKELCYDCRNFPKSFTAGLSLFHYNKLTRPLMTNLKYHNKRILADYLTEEIVKHHAKELRKWPISYIVPVPIHKNKKRSRGYNQAELLAKSLSEKLGIPSLTDLLLRTQDTIPQKTFSAQARYHNLKAAFSVNKKYPSLSLPGVLLIDDIYTSGATMEACTKVLLSAGIQKVYIYSVCIGMSRD